MLNAVRNPKRIASSGLASFPFARHYSGNLGWFLFLALLRCFSSGGSPHIPILFSIWCTRFACTDCSIRKSTDHSVLTAPRSLSQLITSFFGSQCQGIRPALFLALPSCFMFLSPLKELSFSKYIVVFLPDIFSISLKLVVSSFALLLLYSIFKLLYCSP